MVYGPMFDSGTGVKVGAGYKAPVPTYRKTALQPKSIPATAPRFNPTPNPTVNSGVSSPSYNNVPVSSPSVGSAPKAPDVGADSWIDQLKKSQSASTAKGPTLPGQIDLNKYAPPAEIDLNKYKPPAAIDLDKYNTDIATIEDIAKKYGFDYSREYAERQAEAIAQAQRDQIATARERSEYEVGRASENIGHDFFNQYLQQRQQLANHGLNAGIADERNLRLEMNKQHAMSDVYANAQMYNQELDRREGTISKEELAYAEQLFNERLQQGFGNAMEYTGQQRQENQSRLQAALQQRSQLSQEQQNQLQAALQQRGQVSQERYQMLQAALTQRDQKVQEAWKEYEWNNMSASEKQKLMVEADRFGMEMAWERHKFDASMQFEAGLASFNQSPGGGGSSNVQMSGKSGANFTQFKMSSSYGTRNDPFGSGKKTNHKGVDFATPMNTPISASVGGTVIHSGYTNGGFGTYVAVKDSKGMVHIYGHLNGANVKNGQKVSPGQIIGRSGNSGRSTGAHLHYEVRKGSISGGSVNPMTYL